MKNQLLISFLILFCLGAIQGQSLTKEQRKEHFNIKKSIGISGYDPVSYFEDNEPLKGDKTIKASYNGIVYYFSKESNKELFLKAANKYEPEYGGWCAYAMGKDGSKVSINPKTFKIIDNKLYLFYNKLGTNTLELWNNDEKSLYKQAEKYWNNTIK